MEEKHFVYIIFSHSNNIYYKGYSQNPFTRLKYHNQNKSRYTSNKGPWELVYIKSFADKRSALKYERMLKRQNSKYLRWLIEGKNNELFK